MRTHLRDVWALLRDAAKDWDKDNASRLSAALAYYALLSVAPLVVVAVAVAGLVFGREAASNQVAQQIGSVVGAEAARAIETLLAQAQKPSTGIVSTVIGTIVLLFGASGVFTELSSALNSIWQVAPKPGAGARDFVRHRFLAFAMVLAVAFLLLVSLVLSAGVSAIGHFFSAYLPGGETSWQLANFAFGVALSTGLFALIFKFVPDVEVAWRDLWVGAFTTALLFSIGKSLLGLYIGKAAPASAYGGIPMRSQLTPVKTTRLPAPPVVARPRFAFEPRVVPIYWDAHFRTHPLDVTILDEFLRALFQSSWMTELARKRVAPARLLRSFVPRKSPPARLGPTAISEHVADWVAGGLLAPLPKQSEQSLLYLVLTRLSGERGYDPMASTNGCIVVPLGETGANLLEMHSSPISQALAAAFSRAARDRLGA
jgi:membrane protein